MKRPLKILGLPFIPSRTTVLPSAPTSSRKGKLLDVVLADDTNIPYILVSQSGSVYTWKSFSTVGSTDASDFQQSVLSIGAEGAAVATEGNRYLSNATGALWTADYIYTYEGGSWIGLSPTEGMLVFDEDTAAYYLYSGAAWASLLSSVPDASESVKGIAEIATNAETIAGTDDTKFITPAKAALLGVGVDASESVKGIAELSTQAETIAYTLDDKIVTPLKLGQAFAAPAAIGTATPAAATFSTLALTTPLAVTQGGTAKSTWVANTLLFGNGVAAPTETSVGSDGQVLLGATGGSPAWATLASSGGTVTYTPTSNALNVDVTSSSNIQKGAIEIATGAEVTTATATDLAVVPSTLETRLGTQTVYGIVAGGGGAGTNLGIVAPGTNGQVLLGATGAATAFATLTSTDSTIAFTAGANTLAMVVRAGTEAQTGVVELATSAETTTATSSALAVHPAGLETRLGTQTDHGVLLGGGGAGFNLGVTAVGTDGQIIVGSTGGDPAFATIGGLTGLNAIVGAASLSLSIDESYVRTADIEVSTAEIVALIAAPKELVAAPAAGKVIHLLGAVISLDYATAAFNAPTAAGDDLGIIYAAGAQISETLEATGFVNSGADIVKAFVPSISGPSLTTAAAIQLKNIGANEFVNGGGATGVLKVRVMYRIVTTGL